MLLEKLQADVVSAQKAKAAARLETLRLMLAQVQNKAIEKRADLTDEEVLQILRKEVKKRQDSIALYQKGDRAELAAKEQAEIKIIEEYLPKQLSLEELKPKVQAIINEQGLAGQPFGLQMKAVKAALGDSADGGLISQALKEISA